MDDNIKLEQLLSRLQNISERQELFQKEIKFLRSEIESLKNSQEQKAVKSPDSMLHPEKESVTKTELKHEQTSTRQPFPPENKDTIPSTASFVAPQKPQSNIEKFIGENLISKIGIIITVIGIAIGAKYAIDNQLISPLTRIILGYIAGLILLGLAVKLKKNYENFSAVLLSGGMAVMYFITFAAYVLYNLIPQILSFVMMVMFTVFTVAAAINYNKQVIAHIGLVGAYAVPLLLSESSGRVAVLFSYVAIVNTGILFIAFKKYWKPLYYSAFLITWFIYFLWYNTNYRTDTHFYLSLIFVSVFFVTFYLTFLAYKLIKKEKFDFLDILSLLLNSFIFYGIGYSILDAHSKGTELLGLFTLINAVIHFIVSLFIYRDKLVDRNLIYFVSGLVLLFITIAFPVQLDGNWVTLFWIAEAFIMFWIGRTKNIWIYELFSYPLMLLAFVSVVHDWMDIYGAYRSVGGDGLIHSVINIGFGTSLFFIASFLYINILFRRTQFRPGPEIVNSLVPLMRVVIPTLLLIVIYFSFVMEINNYFARIYTGSAIKIPAGEDGFEYSQNNTDIIRFKDITVICFSFLYLIILSIVNISKIRSRLLGYVNLGLNALWILIFLVLGLFALSLLRDSYLDQTLSEYYYRGVFNLVIRYIAIGFAGALIITSYKYIRQDFIKINLRMTFDIFLHISLLWIASSELINWMDIFESGKSYKLGLSILWGIYALFVVVLGIINRKKYLRIGAIVLLSVTLLKLFFYDIAHLNTISKTIVFISLGVLLLSVSFLYNKYKNVIFDE